MVLFFDHHYINYRHDFLCAYQVCGQKQKKKNKKVLLMFRMFENLHTIKAVQHTFRLIPLVNVIKKKIKNVYTLNIFFQHNYLRIVLKQSSRGFIFTLFYLCIYTFFFFALWIMTIFYRLTSPNNLAWKYDTIV